jgi:photosynthetic reaction center H subunit
MSVALTSSIDVAQVAMYVFWIFFVALIFWIRREDRREGYPLEFDNPARVAPVGPIMMASPKTFHGHDGDTHAPNLERDTRPIPAERSSEMPGSAYIPTGEALQNNIGAAAYAQRKDTVEHTIDGKDLVVPMRVAPEASVLGGADPRGFTLIAGDKKPVGPIVDVWFDRADVLVRYLEVDVGGSTRLVPMPLVQLHADRRTVSCDALLAHQVALVPTIKHKDRVTTLEEERVGAFFAGGRLYAEPSRLGPLV